MLLKNRESGILRNLIGKKAEAIIIPNARKTVADPVSVILVMSNKKGIMIDSCFRTKKPTEIPENYPQMRIQEIENLPAYTQMQRIPLGTDGEIIRRVQLVNEELQGERGIIEYSRAVHINFTGEKEAAFVRGSYRTANMKILMDEKWDEQLGSIDNLRQVITL